MYNLPRPRSIQQSSSSPQPARSGGQLSIDREMREEEEEPNWFAQWEAQLPSPEELMPLSQSLITPDLALAFDIAPHSHSHSHSPSPSAPGLYPAPSSSLAGAGDAAESDNAGGGGGAGSGEEPARTLKRPRLVWTPQLHKRFVDAVAHLGIKNAVPKTIMQLMSVDGLTRENVASHLQKYRLYLKRMQGLSSSAGPGAPASGPMSAAEAAEHHLFAAGPLPHHFLHRAPAGAPAQDHYLPYVPVPSLHQHQQQQMATATATAAQYYNPRHFGGGQFDHGFLSRQPLQHATTNHPIMGAATAAAANYGDELELGSGGGGGGGGRKILTLFPAGDD